MKKCTGFWRIKKTNVIRAQVWPLECQDKCFETMKCFETKFLIQGKDTISANFPEFKFYFLFFLLDFSFNLKVAENNSKFSCSFPVSNIWTRIYLSWSAINPEELKTKQKFTYISETTLQFYLFCIVVLFYRGGAYKKFSKIKKVYCTCYLFSFCEFDKKDYA